MIILRRVRNYREKWVTHSQNWVKNQLHRYYITISVLYHILKALQMQSIMVSEQYVNQIPVTRQQFRMMCDRYFTAFLWRSKLSYVSPDNQLAPYKLSNSQLL